MDLKCFDHGGYRWMEGDFEGRWFALDEWGQRLILETPVYGFTCFEGNTNAAMDRFSGASVGVKQNAGEAFSWLNGEAGIEPWRVHKPSQAASRVCVPLGAREAAC